MSAILVLGAIAPFCDLIEDIKEMGYETVVCDYYEDAAAKKNADYSYNISTMNVEKITEIAVKHGVIGIVSAFSDRNLMPHLEVARKLGLPCFYTEDIIQLITNKDLMKEKLVDCGFPIIKYKVIQEDFEDSDLEGFSFPVIIKPIDSYGSKGIYVCHDVADVRNNFRLSVEAALIHKKEVIIEEYYPYDEISISIWVKKGKVYITCIYDVGKNFGTDVVLSSVIYPSKYQKSDYEKLKEMSQKIVDKFEIAEGPVTIQCFIGPKGLRVSEVLYRLAGGSPYLYPVICGGPNTAKMLVDLCLNKPVDYQNLETFQYESNMAIYDYKIGVSKPCILQYDFNADDIKKIFAQCIFVQFYRNSGEKIINVPKNGEPVIRIFFKVNDREKDNYRDLLIQISEKIKLYNENHEDITVYNIPNKKVVNLCYPLKIR